VQYADFGLTPTQYIVEVFIADFIVKTYEQMDLYTSWMALGNIGGLAMFLYLIHKYAMFIIGFLVVNDSILLSGGSVQLGNKKRECCCSKKKSVL
jgi:hypothetical protein